MSEWYGELPQRWETHKISELFTERNEKVSDRDFIPLSVSKGGIVPQIATVAKSNVGDNRKRVKKGDFAINSRSDRRGSSGVSDYDGSVSLINIVLTPRNATNGRYWHYLLKCHNFIEEYYRNGRGIVADLWTTRLTEMKTIYLPLPPRDEQDQIVRFLDWKVSGINRLINAKKKQITLLQEQKRTMINATLSDIEADTIICRYIGTFQNGISEAGDFFTDGFPFVNYGDVYNNITLPETVDGKAKSNEKQQNTYSVQEGDMFFTRTSETIDEVGLTSVCFKSIEKAVFSGFVIRMRPKKDLLDNTFAKFYFRSQLVRNYFMREMNLVTRASLGQTLLKNLPVLLPPLNVQRDVGKKLTEICDKIDYLIDAIEKEISLLHEYCTRLISDAITGKLDVRDIIVSDYEYVKEMNDTSANDFNEMEGDNIE